jgi:hypothetical protein
MNNMTPILNYSGEFKNDSANPILIEKYSKNSCIMVH